MGFGRHPNKDDPPPLWRIKVAWWTALSVSCFVPQLIGSVIMRTYPEPLSCLVAMGLMMFAIILFETYASNKTGELIVKYLKVEAGSVNELTYLGGAGHPTHAAREERFLQVHVPKKEQEEE
jgi:hypothetical protein